MNVSATLIPLCLFALVLWAQAKFGARCAGLFAALPFTTITTCVTAYLTLGAMAVANVLLGALISIGGSAVGAQVYVRLRRHHPALAWLAAVASFAGITLLVFSFRGTPVLSAAIGLALIGACMALPSASVASQAKRKPETMACKWYSRIVGSACIVGCGQLLAILPGALVGVLAGAPVLGFSALVATHVADRKGAALPHQAHGYCEGLLMKWTVIVSTYFTLTNALPVFVAFAAVGSSAFIVWTLTRIHRNVNRRREMGDAGSALSA